MKIGVDGWRMQGRHTGVGTVLTQVLSQWDAELLPADTCVTLYTPVALREAGRDLPSTITERVLPPNWSMLPWQSLRLGPTTRDDVLFCPSYSSPLVSRAPTVVMMFEATQRMFPSEYGWRTRFVSSPIYGLSGRGAARVITTTAAARDDIVREYRVSPDRVAVIPLAPGSAFRPTEDATARDAIRERMLGSKEPFFLHVGKLTRRRNVPKLMRAFAEFKRVAGTSHRLVVVGLRTLDVDLDAMARELGIEEDFRHFEYVPLGDLSDLYAAADAFVLPYTYEALSLTALEAQAAGAPVIITDTPGLREQTGGHALYLDAVSEPALVRAFTRLVEGEALPQQLRRDGIAHARSFSWRATARSIMEVLTHVATG